MGLYKKREAQPAPEQKEILKTDLVGLNVKVNLTENSVKIDVPDGEEGTLVKGVYLWEEDGIIRGLKGDQTIFEVNKRSKAYKELEPLTRKKTQYIVLKKAQSDYGIYYRLTVKMEMTREEAGL